MKLRLVASGVLALFAFLLLGLIYPDYLSKIDDLSIFLFSSKYFADCMSMPAGALEYGGTFLVQFFHYPWLGAAVYALVLVALMWMVAACAKLPTRLWCTAALPPAMSMLTLLSLGYMVFTFKPIGFAFSNLLGYAFAAAAFWVYRSARPWWLRAAIALAIVAAGYPLCGFYALLAAAMIACREIASALASRREKPWVSLGLAALAIASAALVPQAFYYLRNTYLLPGEIYTAGLPAFYPNETEFFAPTIIACAYMLAIASCNVFAFKADSRGAKPVQWASAGVMAAAMVAIVTCRNTDPNVMLTIKLDRALHQQQWQRAVDIARANEAEPTRLNVLLTDIALMRLGEAGDSMFKIPNGCAPYLTTRVATAMRDAGAVMVNYHFGRIYNAYRWGMEYMVGYGMRAEILKMMAKCAIINGEADLADKYLSTLEHTWMHKSWTKKYRLMLSNPDLIADDPEMAAIRPLTEYVDHLEGDGGKIETYLLPTVAKLQGGNDQLLELSMQCALIQKDIDRFMQKFRIYATDADRIPDHYQEAAILWSLLKQNRLYRRLNLDPELEPRFNRFITLNQQYSNMQPEKAAELMKPAFGDTYWFYFFYNNDLKTY